MTSKRAMTAAALILAVTFAAAPLAVAQPQRLDDASLEAAWTQQAKSAALELGLSDDATKSLAEAYIATRKSHREAVSQQTGDDFRARFEAAQKAADEQREAFKKALAGTLTEDQVTKVLPTLGSYNRQWDRAVHVLQGFNLPDDKLQEAMKLTGQYVVELDAARAKAVAAQDMETMRSGAQAAKQKLDDALAGVLSEEQLATWKEQTAFRGRGGRG